MNERKEAMKAALQAESGASRSGLRSPEQEGGFSIGPWETCLGTILAGDGSPVVLGKANAARIVQCVNSHDDIVAALEGLLDSDEALTLSTDRDVIPEGDMELSRLIANKDNALSCARAALLKDRGEA